MDKYIISGGNPLKGEITVSGAKNVALKAIVAGLLTEEDLIIENIPLISDLFLMKDIIEELGAKVKILNDHKIKIQTRNIKNYKVPLEAGARLRTSSMVIGPLLSRIGKAIIPNPGGCRIGQRPIDRHIKGLEKMGVKFFYNSDGYYHASVDKFKSAHYRFEKNSHTGTETLILASVLGDRETVIENAAAEPEVDDLIRLLSEMGANVKRVEERKIYIKGVKKLNGAVYKIMPDRNEVVTFAVAAIASGGDLVIKGSEREYLKAFLKVLDEAGGGWEPIDSKTTRFFYKGELLNTHVTTFPYPGFMTDWQGPWSVIALKSKGVSTIHETIYENRFGYVGELKKMGAKIEFFSPKVENPEKFYNFNWQEKQVYTQAIKIFGPATLHNAILNVSDLRAGATLVLAALVAFGESYIYGIEHIDRGYENFEERLRKIGAKIRREKA